MKPPRAIRVGDIDWKQKRSPSALTILWLRCAGYRAGNVERRKGPVTVDLFGFADIVAFRRGEVLLVQATTTNNQADRMRKILDGEITGLAGEWVSSGRYARLFVVGWAKPRAGSYVSTWRQVYDDGGALDWVTIQPPAPVLGPDDVVRLE